MKKLIVLLLLSIPMVNAFAQTDLKVFSNEGAFTLYVNGNKMNEKPVTRIQVKELTGDDCQVKVVFEDAALGEVKTDVYFENAVQLVYQAAKKKNGKVSLRLSNDAEYMTIKQDTASEPSNR
jgi:hypothetical protein